MRSFEIKNNNKCDRFVLIRNTQYIISILLHNNITARFNNMLHTLDELIYTE